MSPTGRPDSKYVRKMHYAPGFLPLRGRVTTRCGKRVKAKHATHVPTRVTCMTCALIWDLDPDWDPDVPEKENDDETE